MQNAMDHSGMAGVIGVGFLLGVLGIQDLRKKQVSMLLVWLLLGVGIMIHILSGERIAEALLSVLLLGSVLGAVALASKQAVGAGDAWVVAALGGYLGLLQTITVLFYGLVLCAAAGGILLVCKKGTRKMQIPFLPFLFLGYCIYMFVEQGGSL